MVTAYPEISTARERKPIPWSSIEGAPTPLGVTWIEEEQAFKVALFSEHAESVTLLLFAPSDLIHPSFTKTWSPASFFFCITPLVLLKE